MSSPTSSSARELAFQLSKLVSQPFDLYNYLPYRLALVSNLMLLDRDPNIRALTALNARELRILLNIGSYGPVHAADIVYQSRLDPYTVSRAIMVLQQQQMIEPVLSAKGKIRPMVLTSTGCEVYQQLTAELTKRAERLLQGVDQQQQQLLSQLLQIMEVNAENMLAEHCHQALERGESITREQQEFIRWQQRSQSTK